MRVDAGLRAALEQPRSPVSLTASDAGYTCQPPGSHNAGDLALPPVYPEWLGGGGFCAAHDVRFPYVVGEMARGIASPDMVVAAAQAGFLGFYGSAGLQPAEVGAGLSEIRRRLDRPDRPFGANLIHTPQQPGYENAIVDLFLAEGITRVSASAYMRLSAPIVRYMAAGLSRGADGQVVRRTHVFAKVSRAEVASQFIAPPPAALLSELVAAGAITPEQAELASRLPLACDITAEADSGGHTDNRPAFTVFSSLHRARADVCRAHGLDPAGIRIGLAGGIATPISVAGAFAMGAAYVLTGSINQACRESGLSAAGRALLVRAGPADVAMAPAADMFEQGVKVQVLKRGTLFAPRAEKLYRLYRDGAAYETLDNDTRDWLEGLLGEPFESAWAATRDFLARTAPETARRGDGDAKVRFALVCRRYLFMGAQWAREGTAGREADFQIWCGPSMGAFNEWAAGSFLESAEERSVAQVGWNLLEGAVKHVRAGQLRSLGIDVPPGLIDDQPRRMAI